MLVKNALQLLRRRPAAPSTDEERAAERYRLAFWSIVTEVLSRIGGLVLMVMSIKWAAPYLGTERFGAWATLVSLPALLAFLDMGVANALTNRVAHAVHSATSGAARASASAGLAILLGISLLQGLTLYAAASFAPWETLLKLGEGGRAAEVRQAAQMLAIIASVTLIGNGVNRILYGLQRAYVVHLGNGVASIVALVAVHIAIREQASMSTLIVCQLLPAPLIASALGITLRRDGLLSGTGLVSSVKTEGQALMRTGALFFFLQLGTTVGWNADSAILATTTGAATVAMFSVTARLFQIVSQPLSVINSPLWAAYADAHASGDHRFIQVTFRRSIAATLSLSLAGVTVCFAAGQWIVETWTSHSISTTPELLAMLGIWTVLECCGNALSMLLNGLGIIRQQVMTAILFMILTIPTKIMLASSNGATGLVMGSIVSYVIALGIGYGICFRRDILNAMSGRTPKALHEDRV